MKRIALRPKAGSYVPCHMADPAKRGVGKDRSTAELGSHCLQQLCRLARARSLIISVAV